MLGGSNSTILNLVNSFDGCGLCTDHADPIISACPVRILIPHEWH